jgi:hypothetical protein
MSLKYPDELQHLSRAILIMLVPFGHASSLPSEIRKRVACREYWTPLGGVDSLCEELHRLFASKYARANNGSPYNFPKELSALLEALNKMPSRSANMGDNEKNYSALCKLMECPSVSETLRRLGESRYNQDSRSA